MTEKLIKDFNTLSNPFHNLKQIGIQEKRKTALNGKFEKLYCCGKVYKDFQSYSIHIVNEIRTNEKKIKAR
jgi:hypothetical protein